MRSLPSSFAKPSLLSNSRAVMSSASLSSSAPSTSTTGWQAMIHVVPGLTAGEISAAAAEAFARHSSSGLKRTGSGVAIVWFRNDLRVLDNEALLQAWATSAAVLPVYCVDPRHFGATHYFGFPKTGALRAKFLLECLHDLKKNLKDRGLDLLVRHGRPEDILPTIAKVVGAHTVFAQNETCSEELEVEMLVSKALQQVALLQQETSNSKNMKLELKLIWGSTMYHIDDLPFDTQSLPDVYTLFRKSVESKSSIRECYQLPVSLGPLPSSSLQDVGGWGSIPSVGDLGLQEIKSDKGMHFMGGENAALGRLQEYFWEKDLLKVYKETRNGMVGPDYSTKFSPWLASGSLSPRYVYAEVKRYEKERVANDSTYWVLFELIWRDYFRFCSMKYGNSIFHLGGPRKVMAKWKQDQSLFESWKQGHTGYPLVDANMKELSATGFMSNRGRQVVCSFLVRDMGLDWRMGAEWFESCLLDYDPCSNYGNWNYGAGVGNDPREDRYFSIPKQARTYDPEGEYVSYWLPELRSLPIEERNFPGRSYIK
ncbi:Cryptochrome DASH, chloroplastic/mitochondrial [Apostasia shenzhenica]|uniref:Cryptochrome DASH n=1 Tax=Apostasia shenzhenica TaxID=1088818 RepID=A0A2I0A5L3_9ASPA|nr:Cryptochrome DASH, chloroplastic/mitochondrial [Apostasia shenzhenica]